MATQLLNHAGTKITIQIEVDLSGSMMEIEETILKSVNEVGAELTKEGLKRFDADGEPLMQGDVKWYSRGQSAKTYQTPYGDIEVNRHLYQRSGGGVTFCPLECNARIVRAATPRFAKMVTHKLTQVSGKHVKADLEENHGRAVSKLLVQELGLFVGAIAQAKEENWEYAIPKLETPITAVGIGVDGTCVLLCDHQWRETMAGSISLYDAHGERQHTIYVGAAPEYGKETFFHRMEQEIAHVKALYPEAHTAGIADGAKSNWSFLRAHVDQEIVDFYHASEYLTKAAEAIWDEPNDQDNRAIWLNEHCSRLKHESDGAETIFKEFQAVNTQGWRLERQEKFAKCLTYFNNQRHRMKYAEYQKAGLPIGSGVTEAACKTLVKQRLCQSGMRWSDRGAQVILSLRALVLTNTRWNQFWDKISQFGVPNFQNA